MKFVRDMHQNLSWKLGFGHAKNGRPHSCPWWADRLVYSRAYLQGKGVDIPATSKRDYYSLIARAIASLDDSTHGFRQALYERARAAQLNSFDPALSPAAIKRERDALEQAIRTVEVEAATAGIE